MADGGQGQTGRELDPAVGTPRMGPNVRIRKRGMLQPTDPTDPEVPAAKRLRAARRKRTMILTAMGVAILLIGLMALLYRMEQQVTTRTPSADVVRESAEPETTPEIVAPAPRGTPPAPAAASAEALPQAVDVGSDPAGSASAIARPGAVARPAAAGSDLPAAHILEGLPAARRCSGTGVRRAVRSNARVRLSPSRLPVIPSFRPSTGV
jgi:hypothetical protein